jgi:hypothetical protein
MVELSRGKSTSQPLVPELTRSALFVPKNQTDNHNPVLASLLKLFGERYPSPSG